MNSFFAKFRLELKKVGKTTRPFRYELNQIPYDYTVEVRNRFKGLDLKDRVLDKLLVEVRDTVQETGIKTIPKKKKCKKAKWLSEEALDYRDIEWFALEMNRDHSVIFETASKYCISDSFVDYDGYSISSKGFRPQ